MAAKSGGPLLTVRIIAPREILYGSKPAMCLLFSSIIGFIGNNIAQKMQNRTDIIMSKQALAKLDRTDLRILEALQHNGGLTNQQLAETVGLSPSPCSRRVQKLEAAGIILKRETVLDARKLGLDLLPGHRPGGRLSTESGGAGYRWLPAFPAQQDHPHRRGQWCAFQLCHAAGGGYGGVAVELC